MNPWPGSFLAQSRHAASLPDVSRFGDCYLVFDVKGAHMCRSYAVAGCLAGVIVFKFVENGAHVGSVEVEGAVLDGFVDQE